jgi:hypothetical protein
MSNPNPETCEFKKLCEENEADSSDSQATHMKSMSNPRSNIPDSVRFHPQQSCGESATVADLSNSALPRFHPFEYDIAPLLHIINTVAIANIRTNTVALNGETLQSRALYPMFTTAGEDATLNDDEVPELISDERYEYLSTNTCSSRHSKSWSLEESRERQ